MEETMEFVKAKWFAKLDELVEPVSRLGFCRVRQTLYLCSGDGPIGHVQRGALVDSDTRIALSEAYKDGRMYLLCAYEVTR